MKIIFALLVHPTNIPQTQQNLRSCFIHFITLSLLNSEQNMLVILHIWIIFLIYYFCIIGSQHQHQLTKLFRTASKKFVERECNCIKMRKIYCNWLFIYLDGQGEKEKIEKCRQTLIPQWIRFWFISLFSEYPAARRLPLWRV